MASTSTGKRFVSIFLFALLGLVGTVKFIAALNTPRPPQVDISVLQETFERNRLESSGIPEHLLRPPFGGVRNEDFFRAR